MIANDDIHREDFLEWCEDHNRRPDDRASLRDYLGVRYPVRYPSEGAS